MILGVLQARATSTRLPNKVLMPILGRAMLDRQVERLRRSTRMERLIVATSTDPSDDAVACLGRDAGVEVFRGSLNDVLDRFYQAARRYHPRDVVRLTGDCPLADPTLIDEVIRVHLEGDNDYTTNALEPTFPDGLDVEIVRFRCLEEAWREATLPSHREHVTPFIHAHAGRYRIRHHKASPDLSGLRWTVDEPEDFELIRTVYEALYPVNPRFTTADVLALLEMRPELKTLNAGHSRNEGFEKSILTDKKEHA